jgi:hypothetical protein
MLKLSAAVVAAAIIAVAVAAAPADAATKRKRQVVRARTYERVAVVRPRITVTKRSYLDGGTEVMPGERKYNDYAQPLGYLSTSPVDPYRGGAIQWNSSSWPPGGGPGF